MNAVLGAAALGSVRRKAISDIPSSEQGHLLVKSSALWNSYLSNSATSSELIELVSKDLEVDAAVIRGWINLYGWRRPEDEVEGSADESLFSVKSDTVYHVDGIDRTMDQNALRDMAVDPLCPFWSKLREKHRRPAMTWLSTLSFLAPIRIDFSLFQNMLDRFFVTIEDLACVFCVEPGLLRRYCDAHGIKQQQYAGVSDVSIAKLVTDNDCLQQVLVHYAQQLYRERAIPIRRVSQNVGLQWQDVWAMGVRHNGWQLPTTETLSEIERSVSNHEI
ncbi:hypothetical protein EZI54_07450 [Marinobacter halodurans]|uniref:Uncharacterized protein n=1 Tax=Marinobacter halodurans TaxID=2528979 RepID=A0ABY1ZQG3_9GAMM|nr:hypothetical protein [Marinobacter halodurans]TBW57487.1 hypothetical protein EZI54_07450 [Marinobacter halodurans]